ncbi:hypothetical protein DOY81_014773, partial [Sarcophaga bullata]
PQGLLNASDITATPKATVGELEVKLKEIYCGKSVSAEFGYIENLEEREWLAMHFENLSAQSQQYLTNDNRKQIAELLIKSQAYLRESNISLPGLPKKIKFQPVIKVMTEA